MFFSIATLQNLNRQANKIVLQPIYEVSSKCQNCFIQDCEQVIEQLIENEFDTNNYVFGMLNSYCSTIKF